MDVPAIVDLTNDDQDVGCRGAPLDRVAERGSDSDDEAIACWRPMTGPRLLARVQSSCVCVRRPSPGEILANREIVFDAKQPKSLKNRKKVKLEPGPLRFSVKPASVNVEVNDDNISRLWAMQGIPPPISQGQPFNEPDLGKLPAALSRILMPLILSNRIAISGTIVFCPQPLNIFDTIIAQVNIFALPDLFSFEAEESDTLVEQLMKLCTPLTSQKCPSAAPVIAVPCSPQELGLTSFYSTMESEHRFLPESFPPPNTLRNCTLRPHQAQALTWLQQRENPFGPHGIAPTLAPEWERRLFLDDNSPYYFNSTIGRLTHKMPQVLPVACGGIVGDEMGMGKTLEIISLLCCGPSRPQPTPLQYKTSALIVCPMALLAQWRNEIDQFSNLNVCIYYGNDRNTVYKSRYDVYLTTYGVVSSDHRNRKQSSLLYNIFWDRIILDEAHLIKNRSTETAKACFALDSRARFALTGTPIHNCLGDLFALVHFLRCEPFGRIRWWSSQIDAPFGSGDAATTFERLQAVLRPILLRRCKNGKRLNGEPYLNLPERHDEIVWIDLDESEQELYDSLFKKSKATFEGLVQSGALSRSYMNVLELILKLRQSCSHAFMVFGASENAEKNHTRDTSRLIRSLKTNGEFLSAEKESFLENLSEDLKSGNLTQLQDCPICLEAPTDPVFTRCGHVLCRECAIQGLFQKRQFALCPICRSKIHQNQLINGVNQGIQINLDENFVHSSKTKRLLQELDLFEKGDHGCKTVVFSQWTSMLDIVSHAIHRSGRSTLRLDGSVSQKTRESILEEFASDRSDSARVLVCSTRVGGVGLNLTRASQVILLDIWWNPATDQQAIDRIHRMGQMRPVRVLRFVVRHSIEERILELQYRKTEVARGALMPESADSDQPAKQLDLVRLFEPFANKNLN